MGERKNIREERERGKEYKRGDREKEGKNIREEIERKE
jgi:hypothetical protein